MATSSIFTVADEAAWGVEEVADAEQGIELRLPLANVAEVADLFDGHTGWSRIGIWPGLWFRVVP